MIRKPSRARHLLPLALLWAGACACEGAGKRPTAQSTPAQKEAMPIVDAPQTIEPDAQPMPVPVPASTQEAAIRALADSIVALPPGFLGTLSEREPPTCLAR